ncbi:MAG TPA: LuxR C-terminal-related transcriptional regulator [Actinoplanes sp.]|nr:LuxR C-terminal-related transcriptional regulator [Actinoplanes sp.]
MSDRPDASVILVVGPPGSGKTQLVASWVTTTTTEAAFAWLTLDGDQDQSRLFWTYTVEALRRAGLVISPAPSATVPPAPVDHSFLVRLAAEVSEHQTPVFLVLDGVTDLSDMPWAAELDFVLRHTSPVLRLVLIGRWDPAFPLHRYRLAGRMTEIRSADLAFTAGEATELLALHGVELGPAKMASLLEHTEGWAAGLRLFAMALQHRTDAEGLVDTLTGNEATIAEYFVDEVLRLEPPHVRSFLLQISILDTFTPELAEAVTGHSCARRVLANLERRNAFVQVAAEDAAAYRFHRLFAELLQAQLRCEAPHQLRQLHQHAATWFANHGRTTEAVGHAVRAGSWDIAAMITVEHLAAGRLFLDDRGGQLGIHLQHLPPDIPTAAGALVAATLALAGGSTDRCAVQLRRAQDIVNSGGDPYTDALTLTDMIVRVLLAVSCGDDAEALEPCTAAELALANAGPECAARRAELTMLLLAAKGTAHSRLGAIDAAAVALTASAEIAVAGGESHRIHCLQHGALIEAYRGRLGQAEKLAGEAIDLAARCGAETARWADGAHIALAWVAMDRYDVEAAGHHLRIADPRRRTDTDPLTAVAFALVRSRRLQARGELRGAATVLDGIAPGHREQAPRWLAREIALSQARLMTTVGRPDQALLLVRGLAESDLPDVRVVEAAALGAAGEGAQAREILLPIVAKAHLPTPVSVEAWLVMATVAAHSDELAAAREALGQALRHAAAGEQRRIVQQVWAQLRRIMRDDEALAEQHRILSRPAGGSVAPVRPGQDTDAKSLVIVEPLSRREMEVLQGMAAMLATEEIAARLFVSINTVKTHVRSILRKLSASRRNEAVRRARALGLL